MATLLETRPSSRQPEAPTATDILVQARYALRWNTPEVAASTFLKNQARIAELEAQAKIGSPTQRAETRNILAKARDLPRLRRLGLASGADEEQSPGMIFAIPVIVNQTQEGTNRLRSNPFPDFNNGASFEWWYLPQASIEGALSPTNEPNIDSYVSRAALGFLVSKETEDESASQPYKVGLDALAASALLRTARYMRDNKLHGRIPTGREMRIKEILHSGDFPNQNIITFSENQPTPIQQATTA